MPQRHIPCLLMRGGTSRAPYFLAKDLPTDREALARVLIAAMGAGSPLQVDGIGGGQATTSKVAILSPSEHAGVDVDYLFAQVHADKAEVDFSPSCGNILAGVGPAALELGLVPARGELTCIHIRNVNTDALIDASVQTPGGQIEYDGDARIDGVPGTAAPVVLNFRNVIGSKTGALFPTGNALDVIEGTEVTCMDVAMPMVIGRARDFGITGHEPRDVLDADVRLFQRIEKLRLEAGTLMGFGDVSDSVIPKFGLLSEPASGGSVCARYFMPWRTHPAYAVTGAICTGCCLVAPGTVAEGIAQLPTERPFPLTIEHPTGAIDVLLDADASAEFELHNAGLLRTARRLFKGEVSIPAAVW
jgi:2-methylaconitate cis-trans-isomerase PrpF